jgi:hypothetical protein
MPTSDHAIVLCKDTSWGSWSENGKMSCLIEQGIMTNIDENG